MSNSVRWPPRELKRLEKLLDELADSIDNRPKHRTDDEQIWLTRFLIIRSCGYLEQVMHQCVTGHLQEKSYGTSRSYSLSWLSRSINPSAENIRTTLGRFDAGFVDEFDLMLREDGVALGDDLGALIAMRHKIAHGDNAGLGERRALNLYRVAKRVADWMIVRLNPDPSWGSSFPR